MADASWECRAALVRRLFNTWMMRRPSAMTSGSSGERSMRRLVLPPSALEPAPGLVHQGRHVRRRGGHRQLARLDARHVEQVADQVAHVVGLLADDAEELEHLGGVQVGRRLRQRGG